MAPKTGVRKKVPLSTKIVPELYWGLKNLSVELGSQRGVHVPLADLVAEAIEDLLAKYGAAPVYSKQVGVGAGK